MATKELQAIIQAQGRAREKDRSAALVTVYKTSGSTYRRPGARMLVLADAGGQGPERVDPRGLGSISGGCLEDDVRERAHETMRTGRATAVCYDTTAEADIIFGSGVGCQGIVHVVIQPLLSAAVDPLIHLARALQDRRVGVLATVCAGDGSSSACVGQFLWLDGAGEAVGTLTDPALAEVTASAARDVLQTRRSVLHVVLDQGGSPWEIFFDAIRPPRSLLICGAGEDAAPLARLGKELGWRVRVVDARRAYATRERFPGVDELVVCPPHALGRHLGVEPGEAVVLMTHNFSHDLEFLRVVLASPAAYIGILGPSRRTERLLADVGERRGSSLDERGSARIHGPVGLDIGAEDPEQIALAIVAEIVAVAADRPGGILKLRRAPLHDAPKSCDERPPGRKKMRPARVSGLIP